jgi:hypothetical protein
MLFSARALSVSSADICGCCRKRLSKGITVSLLGLLFAYSGGAVDIDLLPLKNGGTSPVAFGSLGPSGGTFSSPLPSQSNPASAPGRLDLTAAPGALLSQRDLAAYVAPTPYSPQTTDLFGAVIVYQFSIDDFMDLFDSSLSLNVQYPLADVAGLQSGTIDLFEYDINVGLWRRLRANSFPPPLLSSSLAGKAMLGIGGIPIPGAMANRRLFRFPEGGLPLPVLFAAALSALLWALASLPAVRRKRFLPVAMAAGLIVCTAGLVFSTPEVTGNPPVAVDNMRYTSSKDQQIPTKEGVVPGKCVVYELERYKGAGDPTDPKNWNKASNTEYFPDSINTLPFQGATRQPEPLVDQLKYDCAGFALRNKAFIPLNPNTDGKAILDNEYRLLARDDKPRVGDILVYKTAATDKKPSVITHYAVVTAVDAQGNITEVESKWGRTPRYKHPPDVVPPSYGSKDGVYRKK